MCGKLADEANVPAAHISRSGKLADDAQRDGVVWEMDKGLHFMIDYERMFYLTTRKLPDQLVVIVPPSVPTAPMKDEG